jgi:ribosomal protein L11 methyltransferase
MPETPRYPYLHVDVPARRADEVAAELWDQGAQGIEQRDASTLETPARAGTVTLVAYFPAEAEARRVMRLFPRFRPRIEHVVGDAWRDAWREHFEPARAGPRLVIQPPWKQARTWPDDVILTLDPGRAFGTGTHESTRLVLRELDRRIRGGESVLDVGCGSGILAVAALLLGARRARCLDVDPDAVEVARENARANRVTSRLTAATTDVAAQRGTFDVVVANIEARVLVPLAGAIAARVAPGGVLVLSGILRGQETEVRAAYPDLTLRLVPAQGEWVALVLERPRRTRALRK